jgi:murein DD-endopeptidase MepM/ murein hydrolase activator NlpD
LYGHCSEIIVHPGQEVRRGQIIGATGNTGLSTGPHLHFEIRVNGVPVDPIGHRP